MKFKTLQGSIKRVSKLKNYLVDWDQSSRSKIQFNTKKILETLWKNHVVFEEFPVAGTRLTLDFYNASRKIAVEVQGVQHRKYVPFFHGNHKVNHLDQLRRDKQKREFCEINDINLIEIYETDFKDNTIKNKLKKFL